MNVTLIALLTNPFIIIVFNIQNLVTLLSTHINISYPFVHYYYYYIIFHFKEKNVIIIRLREKYDTRKIVMD